MVLVRGGMPDLQALEAQLGNHGLDVSAVSDTRRLSGTITNQDAELVLISSFTQDSQVELNIGREVRRLDRAIPLILVTSYGSEEHAIAALRAGFSDYLRIPVALDQLVESIERNLASRACTSRGAANSPSFASDVDQALIGKSRSMQQVKDYIPMVAATDTTVLITGETGTGKELVAELIHRGSPRSSKPFVRINCAALPDDLLESELFGHERGAFTGAHASYPGKLKLAQGGTFFFDEIGEMSASAQAKILRCLENREVLPLGATSSVPLNIRVIAATNQDLEKVISENKFRKDLYFRINVASVHLPPLRDRTEDIPILFDHYLAQMNRCCGSKVAGLCSQARDVLLQYGWPGNVRELKNLVEATFINPPVGEISLNNLPQRIAHSGVGEDVSLHERERLISTLIDVNWNKSKAAERLHWSRMTLYRKMRKYRINL